MKLTVIGYWGAFPEKNEASSGYLLQTKNHNILIDCGSGILSRLQNYSSLLEIDTIILSHYHYDHFADVVPFQYDAAMTTSLGIRNENLKIYGHNLDSKFFDLNNSKGTVINKIDDTTVLNFDGLKVSFKWVKHQVPCLAMRFEENEKILVYSGDTEICDEIYNISEKADLFLCECSLFNSQQNLVKGHLTANEVGKIATKSNVKKVVLTHMPHHGDINLLKEECMREFKGDIFTAKEGMVFNL